MQVCGASLEMEVDTAASSSIISEATYRQLWLADQAPLLYPTEKLYTYTKKSLQVKGAIAVPAHYQGQTAELELVVVAGAGPSLLGQDWLQTITLEKTGRIEPGQLAVWVTPTGIVVEREGTICIVDDKVTSNQAAKVDSYLLRGIDDLLASQDQGWSFTKLDLKAY